MLVLSQIWHDSVKAPYWIYPVCWVNAASVASELSTTFICKSL